MKIRDIHINEFQQFKDLHLDLTYPSGHEKAGQTLNKVCFIGQSGTGKTTILKIIKDIIFSSLIDVTSQRKIPKKAYYINAQYGDSLDEMGKFLEHSIDNVKNYFIRKNILPIEEQTNVLLYFPAEILDINKKIENQFSSSGFDLFATDNEVIEKIKIEKERLSTKHSFDFSSDNPTEIWNSILFDSREYMVNELSFSQKISKALVKNSGKANELVNEFKKWQKENQNPFKVLAEVLNPIIERFNIRVKDDFDFDKAEDLDFIKLETIHKAVVPASKWSTGTKQIVLTAIPIYKLDTTNTVILIDEPERSLYPDIQNEIINYYTKLAPTAQFFFATHSPIIASSFEPWEIVELKFDYKKGKVFQEKYFNGERHIDNYFINPQYLRWDSILTKVFDLKEKGNEKRIEKLMELAALGKKIEKEKDKSKKAEIYKEYKKLSELLDWEIK